jgi:succinate-semialdehyde dehydrogenase/glutarate-semialdehyde dehydrogenase
MYDNYGLYLDGAWHRTNPTLDVHDPATEMVVGSIPDAGADEVDAAVRSAKAGFASWRKTSAWERARILRRAADLIREGITQSARTMTIESGKPLAESSAELHAAADQFEWYAEEARRIYGQTIESRASDVRLAVTYEPVGVVAAFSAWNFPALLPARKIAAALAAGCSVVVRPASEVPGSCMVLVQALQDAGLPAGAANLVTGDARRISTQLTAHPDVRKISFTGSVPVGKSLLKLAADGVKKVSMELGGHAPVIVFADADPVVAAKRCATAKFRNAGQVCISPSRFYVHESIRRPFVETFAATARNIRLGNGLEADTEMGPMANARGVGRAEDLVKDAVGKGAVLCAGGGRAAGFNRGFFFEPTVLDTVPDDARIMEEEPFAPIAPVSGFHDFAEVMAKANGLPFGLAAYLFSSSSGTVARASEALEAGMVGINDLALAQAEIPFGGVKESGMGREGGALGIFDYLEAKFIRHKLESAESI